MYTEQDRQDAPGDHTHAESLRLEELVCGEGQDYRQSVAEAEPGVRERRAAVGHLFMRPLIEGRDGARRRGSEAYE